MRAHQNHPSMKRVDQDVCVVVGHTGHGKSTLLNWLLGERITEGKHVSQVRGYDKIETRLECHNPRFKIGFKNYHSETFHMHAESMGDEYFVCDSPGFGDTAGINVAIAHAAAMMTFLRASKSVRILLVISAKLLDSGGDKGATFRKILEEMREFINVDLDDYMPLVVYTHLGNEKKVGDIIGSLDELQEELQGNPQAVKFLTKCMEDLEKHGDSLLVRPVTDDPSTLRKIVLESPVVTSPYDVFRCPLSPALQKQLQLACREISDAVQTDLKCLKYKGIADSLEELRLLSSYTGVPHLYQTYKKAIQIVVGHYRHNLDAAHRSFEDKEFSATATYLDAVNEDLLDHVRQHEDEKDPEPGSDGEKGENVASISQSYSDLVKSINHHIGQWAITKDNVQAATMAQLGQRLNWLQKACVSLSRYLTNNHNTFKASELATVEFVKHLNSRASYLIDKQLVASPGISGENGSVKLSLLQSLDFLRDVPLVSDFVDATLIASYEQRIVALRELVALRSKNFAGAWSALQAQQEPVVVDSQAKCFHAALCFSNTIATEFSDHLPEFSELHKKEKTDLENCASEIERKIARQHRNYSVISLELEKLEAVSLALQLTWFKDRLLEEYQKLETITNELHEDVNRRRFGTAKNSLDVLSEACSRMPSYLQQAWQQRMKNQAEHKAIEDKFQIVKVDELTEGNEVIDSHKLGRDQSAESKNEVVDVVKSHSDILKTLALFNHEALDGAARFLTTQGDSFKSLEDNLKQLDDMWELKGHIPNLESDYTTLETIFETKIEELRKRSLADSESKGQFCAQETLKNLRTIQHFHDVLRTQHGPRFGKCCATFTQQLVAVKDQVLANISDQLANFQKASKDSLAALCSWTEKSPFVKAQDDIAAFQSSVEGIVAIATNLDSFVEPRASQIQIGVINKLECMVSKMYENFGECLSERLDDAEALRNVFEEMKVLGVHCARIPELCQTMSKAIKDKKVDFAQSRISELDQKHYEDFVSAMQGARAMEKGTKTDKKQWQTALTAVTTHFNVPRTQAATLARKLLNEREHIGHEDVVCLLVSISQVLNLASVRGLEEFVPKASLWVDEVKKHCNRLESEFNERFGLALEQREFVQAELSSAALDTLSENAQALEFGQSSFSSTTKKQRETRFRERVSALGSDIAALLKFGFEQPPLTIHAKPVNRSRPKRGTLVKLESVPALESKESTPCSLLECNCSQCKFNASADPLALDSIFEQLKQAKEHKLRLADFSNLWQAHTKLLNHRIQDLLNATRTLARDGNLKAAEQCLRIAGEIRQSSHVKCFCTFPEEGLVRLIREVQDAGFNQQLSSFDYWAKFPGKACNEFLDLKWKDNPRSEELKKLISSQLLNKSKFLDECIREIKLEDSYTNGQIVPQLSDCFLVRDGLMQFGLPPGLELDSVVNRLESVLDYYVHQAQNCRKCENVYNLVSLNKVLSKFTRDLLNSSVQRLKQLGTRYDPIVKKLIEEVTEAVTSAMRNWELVRTYDFKADNATINSNLVAYFTQLQKNSMLITTVVSSTDVSFSHAIHEMKSKIAELDGKFLWEDLQSFCARPRSAPPALKLVLANLKELTKTPELGTAQARQEIIDYMKAMYTEASQQLNRCYIECVNAPSTAQTVMLKELNRHREQTSAIGKQLSDHTTIKNSDEMVVITLKNLAEETRKNFKSIANPGKTHLADFIVACFRISLNVSMPDVKTYVHNLVKEVLAIARRQNTDFDDLADYLDNNYEEGIGSDVVGEFDEFRAFHQAAFQRKTAATTFESAIAEMIAAKTIDAAQKDKLEAAWALYSKKYSSFGVRSQPISDRVHAVMRQIRNGNRDVNLVVEALAGICAYMALAFAVGISETEPEEIKKIRKNPHPIQIIGLFRLLRIDSTPAWIFQKIGNFLGRAASDSHLIQIGTGEGKSIALGILSIFLALLGYEVHCVCYSEPLSRRDYAEFETLFSSFGVTQKVFYGTFRELSRKIFNEQGDIREGTQKLLSRKLRKGEIKCQTPPPRILLIDEVDVFFSRDFYGAIYSPAATIRGPEMTAALTYIWEHKGSSMSSIVASQPYQALMTKYCPTNNSQEQIIQEILHTELSKMVAAISTFKASPHRVENGKIGIVEHGTIKYDLRDGYNTTCWYFDAMDQMQITREEFDKHVALSVLSGAFSYAEIPKGYQRILGMSGTLDCLGTYEREIMQQYNIKEQTIMPHIYGKRDANFDEGVHYEEKLDQYFQKIAHTATVHSHDAELATLIFFETDERLKQFMDSPYFPQDKDTNVVWTSEHLAHYVVNATKSRRITCFPHVFGRGTDFKCVDKKVAPRGVLVIQTFLSADLSEETQIQGRTCRQGDKGSYKMILFVDDLLNWNKLKGKDPKAAAQPLVTLADLKAEHKEGLATFLRKKRSEWFDNQSRQRIEDVKVAEANHQSTVAFQADLVEGNARNALKFIKSLNHNASVGTLHLVFCLDRSGSMSASWKDLLAAYGHFLQEVANAAPASRISVILFNNNAQVIGTQMDIQQARGLNLGAVEGGTAFAPAFTAAFNIFQADQTLDPCFVFMTDGANGDKEASALQQLATVKNLQSHLVYFGAEADCAAKVKQMSGVLHGHFHHSTDLKAVFQTVAKAVVSQLSHM